MIKRPILLVTGGCGYIGSHVCFQLCEAGYDLIVLDNLSTGVPEALLHGETLIEGDFGDRDLLKSIFNRYEIDAVFHFAASISVEESVSKPLQYYENNSLKFFNLLSECNAAGIKYFVLSSTAAVYGHSDKIQELSETSSLNPTSPYGRSKLFDEWLLEDVARVYPIHYVILRYFNVAGASDTGKLGQRGKGTHLIKVACETALGKREQLTIFGTDYKTADGTCVRDYIHVEDLAKAHIASLNYLHKGKESTVLNCGYNKGYSVLDIIKNFEKVLNTKLPVVIGQRRPGDPPYLVADCRRIWQTLQWQAHYNDINKILISALEWEKNSLRDLSKAKLRILPEIKS